MISGFALDIRAWVPVVACMGAMFALSTDLGSTANNSRFLEPLLRALMPQMAPETFALIHAIIRKAAHLTEYAILAMRRASSSIEGASRAPGVALGCGIRRER